MPVKDINRRLLAVVDQQVKATLTMGSHSEEIVFDVVPTGRYPIIMGISWLKLHNPDIDWYGTRITFVTPHCSTHCIPLPPDILGQDTSEEDFLASFGPN